MLTLSLHDIRIAFGAQQILRGVTGTFRENTLNSVIGINGAGKSVLMKSIAGLLHAQGEVRLSDESAVFGRDQIAYVPQMAYSTSALTAVEMVLLGAVRSLSWRVPDSVIRRVDRMMDLLDISHLAEKRFSALSGGQKQMVVMAQALISAPKVLLLDEPTSALDLYHQLRLLDVTKQYCLDHHAIGIVVMHDLSLVSRYSDEIMLLDEGIALRQGSPEDVLIPSLLEKTYGVEVDVSKSDKGFTTVVPVRVAKNHEHSKL